MELYVIRHGQSLANATRTHAGWAQVPLTEAGIAQARQTGRFLQSIRFDRILVSDLLRAVQTARTVFPGRVFESDPRLREISVGTLAGRSTSECQATLGKSYVQNRTAQDFTSYGGENLDQLLRRVAEFMESLQGAPSDARIAAVCHAGTAFAMLCHVLGCRPERNAADVTNCGVCVFRFSQAHWSLVKWNETGSADTRN